MVKKASSKSTKARRSSSNIFSMFTQNQLSEFKQAFQFCDFNKDGYIDKRDVISVFDSMGRRYPDQEIEEMIAEGGGPINFTTFIRLIGEKIYSGDEEEDDIKTALSKFDFDNSGKIDKDYFFKNLCTFGEKLDEDEVNAMMEFINVDRKNKIDIEHLAKTLNGSLED